MGYGNGDEATDVSYKDIAGVSITRGFHTDADHVWMLRTNEDGTKDVICAQCNGVRKNVTLTDGKYEGKDVNEYQSCVHHGGTNEKMLLVATDGERDFFKCQYCRQIETINLSGTTTVSEWFSSSFECDVESARSAYYKVTLPRSGMYNLKVSGAEDIELTLFDDDLKDMEINLSGATNTLGTLLPVNSGTYYIKIKNNASINASLEFTITAPSHVHDYSEWTTHTSTHHIECCSLCGVKGTVTSPHVVKWADTTGNVRFANCIRCGYLVDLDNIIVEGSGFNSIAKVSVNGSYILPNGIIVLVDEDIEAYLNGTLVFYDKDKLPEIQ